MSVWLRDEPWPRIPAAAVVLVPVGSVEQHGPHLPFDTDTRIATAVTEGVARQLGDDGIHVVVAPPLTYGASGEHQGFAGTVSIGTDVLRLVLVELVRSARTWARRVVFVNGHGGNVPALASAVPQMIAEGHDVGWTSCVVAGADAHAGFTETSVLLHLDPSCVDADSAEAGNTGALRELLPTLMEAGVAHVSPNGVLGDPTGASSDDGKRVLAEMVSRVAALVVSGMPDPRGLLR